MRLQHVSITIPAGGEQPARAFYGDLLGLEERPVPPHLDPDSLIWFRLGVPDLELHLMLGSEPQLDAGHLCIELSDLENLRERLHAGDVETSDATPIIGRARFFCRDPFGNLLEFARIDDPDAVLTEPAAPSS
jgi:catechol 2,3-dioxygenase-like lactoylglutathione lyase family enzyme